MSSANATPARRRSLAPWLAAIMAVYLMTVAAWFVAIDWSTTSDLAWQGRVAALPAAAQFNP